jgi:hypothetical protein
VLRDPFRTELDLSPVYATVGASTGVSVCIDGGGATDARWMAVYEDVGLTRFSTAEDLSAAGVYDAAGRATPLCVPVAGAAVTTSAVVGLAADGHATAVRVLRGDDDHTTEMSAPMRHAGPARASGDPTDDDSSGASTEWHFADAPASRLQLRTRTTTTDVHAATLDLYLTRVGGGRGRFVAQVSIDDGAAGLHGGASGEAVRTATGWELAGRIRLADANGGFRATLTDNGTTDPADDGLQWRFDAARA